MSAPQSNLETLPRSVLVVLALGLLLGYAAYKLRPLAAKAKKAEPAPVPPAPTNTTLPGAA